MTSFPTPRTDARSFVLIGGTSVLGRALLERLIFLSGGKGTAVLAGRESPGLAAAADEIAGRFPEVSVSTVSGSIVDAAGIESLSGRILSSAVPDFLIIALGSPADEKAAEDNPRVLSEKLWINASAPVIFLEIFFRQMRKSGGRMAVFGSVAGDRIRRGNYTYGAAKSLVSSYAEGFSEKARGSGVTLTLIKPGPADTPLGRAAPGKARQDVPCRSGGCREARGMRGPQGKADSLCPFLVAAADGSREACAWPPALAFFRVAGSAWAYFPRPAGDYFF